MRVYFFFSFLVTFLVCTTNLAFAQVEVNERGPFTEMVNRFSEINKDDSRRLQGIRIQIVSTTDRLKLESVQEKFSELFPQYSSRWVHEAPFYKLRTGAFVDRAKATTFLYRIKRYFPSAYPAVVKDIRPSELLQYLN